MRAAFDPKIRTYPYDMQLPELKIASTDYSTRKVKVNEEPLVFMVLIVPRLLPLAGDH